MAVNEWPNFYLFLFFFLDISRSWELLGCGTKSLLKIPSWWTSFTAVSLTVAASMLLSRLSFQGWSRISLHPHFRGLSQCLTWWHSGNELPRDMVEENLPCLFIQLLRAAVVCMHPSPPREEKWRCSLNYVLTAKRNLQIAKGTWQKGFLTINPLGADSTATGSADSSTKWNLPKPNQKKTRSQFQPKTFPMPLWSLTQ